MPMFIAALLGGLLQLVGSLAGRVMLAIGLSFVSYTGVSALLDYFRTQAQDALTGAPVMVMAALGLLQFDVVVGIFVGAATAKLVINGVSGGTLKKAVFK